MVSQFPSVPWEETAKAEVLSSVSGFPVSVLSGSSVIEDGPAQPEKCTTCTEQHCEDSGAEDILCKTLVRTFETMRLDLMGELSQVVQDMDARLQARIDQALCNSHSSSLLPVPEEPEIHSTQEMPDSPCTAFPDPQILVELGALKSKVDRIDEIQTSAALSMDSVVQEISALKSKVEHVDEVQASSVLVAMTSLKKKVDQHDDMLQSVFATIGHHNEALQSLLGFQFDESSSLENGLKMKLDENSQLGVVCPINPNPAKQVVSDSGSERLDSARMVETNGSCPQDQAINQNGFPTGLTCEKTSGSPEIPATAGACKPSKTLVGPTATNKPSHDIASAHLSEMSEMNIQKPDDLANENKAMMLGQQLEKSLALQRENFVLRTQYSKLFKLPCGDNTDDDASMPMKPEYSKGGAQLPQRLPVRHNARFALVAKASSAEVNDHPAPSRSQSPHQSTQSLEVEKAKVNPSRTHPNLSQGT